MNNHVRSERRSYPDLAGGAYKGAVLGCVYLLKGNILSGFIDTEISRLAGIQNLNQVTRRQIHHATTAAEERGSSKESDTVENLKQKKMSMLNSGQKKETTRNEKKETKHKKRTRRYISRALIDATQTGRMV